MLNCSIIQTQHIKLLFLDSDYAESAAKLGQKYHSTKYWALFCSLLGGKIVFFAPLYYFCRPKLQQP